MSLYASRYARAFAEAVEAAKLDPEDVDRQLNDFAATWNGSTELREVLNNPAVASKERVAVLDKINTRMGCSPLVRNFLAVLINHNRLGGFNEIFADFRREMHRRLGIAEAHVTTARKLDDDERRELEEHVARLAGARVEAQFEEDKTILGGAVVRIGSTVYDGSVLGNLRKLREQLIAG
ncbi:MAG TPA: ATP synthase F1 subunit delta [Acidisarcina sp.]|nr:ATP synthase F1 subunit delta [Acidisarcina sp.]